jgi:hypothetical protein
MILERPREAARSAAKGVFFMGLLVFVFLNAG